MSVRCSEWWSVPWKGHTAVLYHQHCRRKTNHPSGKCWQHLSSEDLRNKYRALEAARAAKVQP
jgi:hypothetical protein